MIPISQGFSIAIALLSALPGAAQAIQGLIADIKGHPDLTDAEKADLIAKAKARVDTEDDRVQATPLDPPAPDPKPAPGGGA